MSLKSWIKEFYPIEANKCLKRDALAHSLLKWKGMQKSNLNKHNVMIDNDGDIADIKNRDTYLSVSDYTCALCIWYSHKKGCAQCPLYIIDYKACSGRESPFFQLRSHKNPKPMIKLLKEATKLQEKK